MKLIMRIRDRWNVLTDTILRFPFTIAALIAAMITNTININTNADQDIYIRLFVTFILSAAIASVFQLLYERFFEQPMMRYLFMGISAVISCIYYLLIKDTGWEVEVTIRTTVIFFILLIAFLWVPVIRSRNNFNESFVSAFKGFFTSVFFTGVLFLGVVLILSAVDMLLFNIYEKSHLHSANVIFMLLTPTYFLSLIPFYPKKRELVAAKEDSPKENAESEDTTTAQSEAGNSVRMQSVAGQPEKVQSAAIPVIVQSEEGQSAAAKVHQLKKEEALVRLISPTRFLEALVAYIIIPITAVFTIILLLYIITNITGDFWTDNLMEPLLVSYSITVIIVYLLAASVSKPLAGYFRRIFPKVLVPVVLFQTLSSVLRIGEIGVTYGRYYVILFGIFASIAGILFCFKPVAKNGIIAPILIVLSLISIIPPVDSFTISRVNQIDRLEKVLTKNDMLREGTVVPNTSVSDKDREIIVSSVQYLDRLNYTADIPWLQEYHTSLNFEDTFGFWQYDQNKEQYQYIYIMREKETPISIEGYDFMYRFSIYNGSSEFGQGSFMKNGESFHLRLEGAKENSRILIVDSAGQEIIQYLLRDMFDQYADFSSKETTLTSEELTFTKENEAAIITLVADNININEWEEGVDRQAEVNILIRIK